MNITYLEILYYYRLSDKKFKSIAGLFLNIVYLDLYNSVRFGNKTLNRIAELYPNLKYLNLEGYDDGLITDKGLYAIANSCHKLKYLSIIYRKEFSEMECYSFLSKNLTARYLQM